MRKVGATLRESLSALITSMNYEFVGCELAQEGTRNILRIYIDAPTGLTIDDCSLVSRQVSAMLDVNDPIQGKYALEVSSPGINRPLFELAQYQKYIGSRIKIRLHSPINARRQFNGILRRIEGETIFLSIEGQEAEVELPYSSIDRANVVAEIRL